VGNTWHFQGTVTDTSGLEPLTFTNTISIIGNQVAAGFTATVFRESSLDGSGAFAEYLLAKEPSGIFTIADSDLPQLAPYREVRFPLLPGDTFVQLNRTIDLGEDFDGDGVNEKIDVDATVTMQGFETVTVPMGTFTQCAKLERDATFTIILSRGGREAFSETATAWFAPDVGWVKRRSSFSFDGFSETVEEELVNFVQVSVLAAAPEPANLVAAAGELFWSDASETPVKKVAAAGGDPVPLARIMAGIPEQLAVEGGNLFWTAGPTLHKSSLDGQATSVLATGSQCRESRANLAVDAGSVYWVTSTCSPDTYTLNRVPIAGGLPLPLHTTGKAIVAVSVDASHIYWEEEGIGPITLPDGPEGSTIQRMPISGGTPEILVNGALNGLIGEAPPGHVPGSWHPRGGLDLSGSELIFADTNFSGSYRVMKIPVTGGAVTVLTQMAKSDFVRRLAAAAGDVFWADSDSVNAIPLSGGVPVSLATTPNDPLSIAYFAGRVFWTETTGPANGETGAIKSVSATGGGVAVLVNGGDAPRELALSGGTLFWTEGGPIGLIEGFGRIASIPATGGAIATVVDGIAAQSPPIAVDANFVYIADNWRIKKVPIDGSGIETLARGDDQIEGLATDGVHVFWIDRSANIFRVSVAGGEPVALAPGIPGPPESTGLIRAAGGFVYWLDHFDTLKRVPAGGGAVSVIASDLAPLSDFVTDGVNVYFAQQNTGAIGSLPVVGGTATILASRAPLERRLAVDAENLYWIDPQDVGKIPKEGGGPYFFQIGSVAADPSIPGSIAIDDANLYWTETGEGEEINKATPK
jgi:hypothetical protein